MVNDSLNIENKITKTCQICSISKFELEFSKSKVSKDGLHTICKMCVKEYNKKYKERNKETILESNKQYRIENKESISIYKREYQRVHSGLVNAKTAKRRASRLSATPEWSETKQIKQLYIDCKLISDMTSILHHVDHIIPLQSSIVCGLHVLANLQILTASENQSKNNTFVL